MTVLDYSPLITVIVPVRNGARYLGAAIDSIRRQSYRPLNILVVDDGSTDDTRRIAVSYPEVGYIGQEHSGVAAARNAGLAHSVADFVAFHDADDLCRPERLARQMACLAAHDNVAFCLCRLQDFVDNDEGCAPALRALDISAPRAGFVSSGLFRRSVFEQVGGFDTRFKQGEDLDWLMRAEAAGAVSTILVETLIDRRLHRHNTTSNIAQAHADLMKVVRDRLGRRDTLVKNTA